MKAKVTEILKQAGPNKLKLSKHEQKAINNLRKHESIVITPADKGKTLAVMDKIEYIRKIEEKFSDISTEWTVIPHKK